jgi:o-succinylbenzoate---CoA ligase
VTEIHDPLRLHAQSQPDHQALLLHHGAVSYTALDLLVDRLTATMRSDGIQSGDRVALRSLPAPDTIAALLALWRIGAVACPLSDRLTTSQTQHYLSMCSVRSVFETMPEPTDRGTPATPPTWRLDRDATILLTSGSCGAPKAVVHTLGAHYYSALGSARNLPLTRDDRWLLALPLYHVGGLAIVVRCLLAGATIAVAHKEQSISETLERMHPTHLSLVPTQLHRLIADRSALSQLQKTRAILIGGGPLGHRLASQADAHDLPLATSYGSTEMASQVCATPAGATDRWHTAGEVLPYRELKLVGDSEILVRGQTLCRCLLAEDGSPVTVTDPQGWYHTGDIGTLDDTGDLIVVGRRDNMFISGGENIHPEQIEGALLEISGVLEAIVVPIADQEFGARPVAFLKATSADIIDLGTVNEALTRGGRLERFKLPIAVWELPDQGTDTMKPDRPALERLAARLLGQQA